MKKEDTQLRLRDSEGKEYIIIDSKKVDLQEELNKTIVKQQEEIERLTQGVALLTNELIDMTKEKEKYKSRNEKAIEYIGNGNLGIPRKTREKFIKILQSSDKE